ncbi:RNA polymerase RpoE-like sigma-24 subunit [Natranaerovirga hydrolytica]|uniref:RNA polymerase RpoE-like sigma-24 subunit n=1 Tax=Natranaerovirga hydrolytica TaxID=680378 RepID=A0A4R1MY59_9FIRM|nr:sigma-70 family RNA polymerase sigma factor [Natranaerovirga hydrolytica]TCK98207.1 RNA polymerase RpoE-like sigma-24 subunit [Natranaerovirga hydrolytica]
MSDIEKKLIKKAQKGQVDAFETLIINYEKKIYNLAYQMFHNEQDAYDISQEVFIKVYQSIDKFNFSSKFSTWLHRITVNTAIDEMRKRKNKQTESIDAMIELGESKVTKQYDNQEMTPEDLVLRKERNEDLIHLLNQLKAEHKTIIVLRDIKGFSYEEISQILNCSIGTVKSRLSRARAKLKDLYTNHNLNNLKDFVK